MAINSSGFCAHVTNNAEELRSMFVNFKGKTKLVVENDSIRLNDPNSPWEKVFPEFTKMIGENTGQEIINTLTPNFTTTTPVDKIAAEITIMDAMKEYFEYYVETMICGIPKITLEGTPADWQKLLDKARDLRKYKLDWWIDEIEPPLKQFIRAINGHIDTAFWRNIFKQHTLTTYGRPTIIDGWILKFFPYYKDGSRSRFTSIGSSENLTNEMVTVDLTHIFNNRIKNETTLLELWAGFVGVKEDIKSLGLRPSTGWMVRKKDTARVALRKAISAYSGEKGTTIDITVETIPREILELKDIFELDIHFLGDIIIPDELAHCNIEMLNLYGKVTPTEEIRIQKLFTKTDVRINSGMH